MKDLFKWPYVVITAFFALILVATVVAAIAGGSLGGQRILLLKLDGALHEVPVTDASNIFSDQDPLTTRALVRTIKAAATDDEIAGLVLKVRSPAVGVAQLQELEEAMADFRGSGKWNVAFLETAGEMSRGDGAYALAALAERIILTPPGEINLVGFRTEVPFVKGTLDKLDVDVYVEKRYAYKNAANTFTEDHFTAEHREALVELVDDLQTEVVSHIAARRGVEPEKVRDWMAKGPYAAAEAEALGLVDEVAYWDAVLAAAEEKADREEPFIPAPRFAQRLESQGFGPTFALIRAEGPISRGESQDGFDDPTIGSDTITAAFRDARQAEVKGVLFRIDSPGGSYIASDLIRREVEVTRAAGIPVVASMGNVAASGGYFIAMGCDTIIADPGTITGSIGVFAGRLALRRFYEGFLGVTFDTYETGPAAGIYSSLDVPSELHRAKLSATLDRIYADFVGKAAAGRGKTYDEIHAVAQGRVWAGRDALAHGLVDELGGMELALTRLMALAKVDADEAIELQIFPQPKTGIEALIQMLGGGARMPVELEPLLTPLRELAREPGDRVLQLPFVPVL